MQMRMINEETLIDMAEIGKKGSAYTRTPAVSFSHRDSLAMNAYFNKSGAKEIHGTERMKIFYNKDVVVFSPSKSLLSAKVENGITITKVYCGGLRNANVPGIAGKRFALHPCNMGWMIKIHEPIGDTQSWGNRGKRKSNACD